MTVETVIADKVERCAPTNATRRGRLVRSVAGGDTVFVTVDNLPAEVFTVSWLTNDRQHRAVLRAGGSKSSIMIDQDGTEVLDGLRVSLTLRRKGKRRRNSLVFTCEPHVRVRFVMP